MIVTRQSVNLAVSVQLAYLMMAKVSVYKNMTVHVIMMGESTLLEHKFLTSATPVPAEVENGSAQRRNAQEPALFMEVVIMKHLTSTDMGFKGIVDMLL